MSGRSRVFVGVYGAAALLVGILMILGPNRVTGPGMIPWPLIGLATVLAEMLGINFYAAGQTMTVDLIGIPVIVGSVFCSPRGQIGAAVAAIVIVTFRHRDGWDRLLFNVANHVIGVSMTYLVVCELLGPGNTHTFAAWVAAACVGVIAYEATTTLGVFLVVMASGAVPGREYVKAVAIEVGLIFPFNAVLGTITVLIGLERPWGILLLAGPFLVLGLWYRSSNVTRSRYANLQLLYDFTVKLAGLSDSESIISTALEESRTLLKARSAQLAIPMGDKAYRCELLSSGGQDRCLGDLTSVEARVVEFGAGVRLTKGRSQPDPDNAFDDLIAAPVPLGEIGSGVLVVADHAPDGETFEPEDQRLFEALAAHLSAALTSSRRLDQLRLEMAAREHQALHDGLTGLANRTLFAQWVAEALAERSPEEMVAVLIMDLDGFKDINDSLGHQAGDKLLREVATRIETRYGSDRVAARLGGDEFAFVLPGLTDENEMERVARSLIEATTSSIAVDGLAIELRASGGVAVAPRHGVEPATLLQKAEVAMYEAKSRKRGVVAYDADMEQSATRRLTIASGLRRAFDTGQLEMWYQPVVQADNGAVSGCEALMRWRTDLEFVTPSEFIPVAEQTGLIEPLTWWALETSLRELKQWQIEGICPTIAVNLSARCLQAPDVVDRIRRLIRDMQVIPESLTLEITESLLMSDPDYSGRILSQLKALGVKVAIDDFGTGYSSLSRLKTFPVHTIKIDREFVMDMHTDDSDEAIVRATVQLGRALGHEITAEGVEDFETWHRLRALGCDHIQGYLLSAAMPAMECRRWLRAHKQSQALTQFQLGRFVGGATPA